MGRMEPELFDEPSTTVAESSATTGVSHMSEGPAYNPLPRSPPTPVSAAAAFKRLGEEVTEAASRLSVLEERLTNLRKKEQLTEHSLIDYSKETRADLKALTETMTELAHKVEEVKEKIGAMAAELGTVVKKPEFMVLERYMDLWQPLDFITREEAKLLLRDAVNKSKE